MILFNQFGTDFSLYLFRFQNISTHFEVLNCVIWDLADTTSNKSLSFPKEFVTIFPWYCSSGVLARLLKNEQSSEVKLGFWMLENWAEAGPEDLDWFILVWSFLCEAEFQSIFALSDELVFSHSKSQAKISHIK